MFTRMTSSGASVVTPTAPLAALARTCLTELGTSARRGGEGRLGPRRRSPVKLAAANGGSSRANVSSVIAKK